ncbi:MAG: TrkA C-terminal domain-containing protein, partial [Candidatus Adiutrix sp.]
ELFPHNSPDNILLAAIYRNHNLLIPRGDTLLKAGDLVYVVAPKITKQESAAKHFYNLDPKPIKTVTIVGGGEVGYLLAKRLENDDRHFNVKLIEQKTERCLYLTNRLKKAIVIKGDGTDRDLLIEENIGDSDAFIAVSTDDEKNLISCLVAKRLGVRHTMTRVNRFSYAPLVSAIGLESLVSVRVAAVSAILKYMRKGGVISVATLANEDAEIVELQIMPHSKAHGQTVMDIRWPRGSLVAALTRGDEIIIPRGNTQLAAGDILVLVAKDEALSPLRKILGVS